MKEKARCLVYGAGAVGLLCAAVAKIEYNSSVAIADIDQGRVQFALDHGFADTGFVVVPRQGKDLKERLSIAKELSVEIGKLKWPQGGKVGRVEHVFECTGIESCVQTSIYVGSHVNSRIRTRQLILI
jgi:L-iditol 2-dehydrogenase